MNVDFASELKFNLDTQTNEITGKRIAITLGRKTIHSNDFKEFWLMFTKRLIKKAIAGIRIIRPIILT